MKENSLLSTIRRNVIRITLLLIAFLFVIFVGIQIWDYHTNTNRIKELHIEERKQLVKSQAESAINHIKEARKQINQKAKKRLKNEVGQVSRIFSTIHGANNIKSEIPASKQSKNIRFSGSFFINFFITGNDSAFTPEQLKSLINRADAAIEVYPEHKNAGYFDVHVGKNTANADYIGYYTLRGGKMVAGLLDFANFRDSVQMNILETLSTLHYGEDGYIFVNTMKGIGLLTDNKVLTDSLLLWAEKPYAKKVFKKELKAAEKPGGDFITYYWPRLEDTVRRKKISYIAGIPEWNWIVGSGVYTADVEQVISKQKRHYFYSALYSIGFIVLVLFIVLYILRESSRKTLSLLNNDIMQFTSFLNTSWKDYRKIDTNRTNFKEFKSLGVAANNMLDSLRKYKQSLEEKTAFFETLFASAPEAIALVSVTGIVERVNKQFEELFGYSSSEAVGTEIDELLSKDSDRSDAHELTREVLEGKTVNAERLRYTKAKTPVDVSILATPVFVSGKHMKIYAIYRNISARKQFENELREAKILAEKSDKLKSSFLSNLSHEVRTPMNAIVGFSKLLRTKMDTGGENAKYLDLVEKNSRVLLELITNIVELAKVEADAMKLTMGNSSLDAIIEEAEYYIEQRIEFRQKVNVRHAVLGDSGLKNAMLYTDSTWLKQVLEHLIDNAVKFTEQGWVRLIVYEQEQGLVFRIADTGIGVSENTADFIFGQFNKVETDINTLYRGTGIGLYLCKRITDKLGARIWLESKIGEGSDFYVFFPENYLKQGI